MSPERAWKLLMFEFNIHPDSVPTYVPELIADAAYWRAKQLVENGTYPKHYDGPNADPVGLHDWPKGEL